MASDFQRVETLIRWLDAHQGEQPCLAEIAAVMELSESRVHRLFRSWAGVTPKGFLQCLTAERVRESLRASKGVLDTALDAGLSGPGRLHDLCVNLEGASPGEIAARGRGWVVRAGFANSPFGEVLLAAGPRGICHLSFLAERSAAWRELEERWGLATFERNDSWAADWSGRIFAKRQESDREALQLWVQGSAFQLRVWRALIQVPSGAAVSYGELARAIESPGASRAVGTAVGKNPLAYLIPCHRVIRETGVVGNYRWGRERKRALLAWEQGRVSETP